MLSKDSLKDLLHQSDTSKVDKILLCLAIDADNPKQLKEIKTIAVDCGLRGTQKWNVSGLLSKSAGLAIRTSERWELTSRGKDRVREIARPTFEIPSIKISSTLRQHLTKISDPQIATFVTEAVGCCEARFYRSAVVLSWVGAVSVLYDDTVKNYLKAFNAEASRRNPKWKDAKNADDLTRMKEGDFMDILDAISVIGKNVKQELKKCLDLRNSCGHPNNLLLSEYMVAAHIETLISVNHRFAGVIA